ncbi:MAG: accessory Sec system protein Asp2 [Lachnospiraceae bacterium]|nr:accessory Sec system protein Asp2 [Lachnospiraceae bacterium]
MSDINVLQIGDINRIDMADRNVDVIWNFLDGVNDTNVSNEDFDLVLIEREPDREEFDLIFRQGRPYTVFAFKDLQTSPFVAELMKVKCGRYIEEDKLPELLGKKLKFFFKKGYGDSLSNDHMSVAQGFKGEVYWNGNVDITLIGHYGVDDYEQILFSRVNYPIEPFRRLEFWLEYDKDPEVEIILKLVEFRAGYEDDVLLTRIYDEEDLKEMIAFNNGGDKGVIFLGIMAKGTGRLTFRAFHNRYSRDDLGIFIPGGERIVSEDREEIFGYFEPGDLKPPLCVYFAGYRTMEGFEGINMMREMKCPFLLLSDARLEGGSFYIGSDEYENNVVSLIRKYMSRLGFDPSQVIISGVSMGSFGALYYGCDIMPYAILVGKPLTSLGNVASNERILRPGGFPTSLDVLLKSSGGLDEDSIKRLNDRFWDKFDNVRWNDTQFIVSYMIEDDYDSRSYSDLLGHLHSVGVTVYGKGIHGRHNDNTPMIIGWFISRLKKLLSEDFGRNV